METFEILNWNIGEDVLPLFFADIVAAYVLPITLIVSFNKHLASSTYSVKTLVIAPYVKGIFHLSTNCISPKAWNLF